MDITVRGQAVLLFDGSWESALFFAEILASAIIPQKENPLAYLYKVPQNDDGFFAEAHVKLRPNDFATDGVFVCGLAHAPKPIEESIAQAQAAASRAVTVLSALEISVSGTRNS